MNLKEKYGPLALIAGASAGLGAAFAYALAAEGMDLVIIGRRSPPLTETADSIERKFQVRVLPIVCDLASVDATEQILAAIGGRKINMLVYNAAAAYIGPFLKLSPSGHDEIIRVNIQTPLKMIHVFGEKMIAEGRGAIVLMSSIAGFQGSGFISTYASSKAFGRILAESLWYEWKNKGVDVIACCAGATATPNYLDSKPGPSSALAPKPQKPENVVEECLRKIGKTPSFVSGSGNKFASFLMRFIFPGKKAINLMGDTTRKMYRIRD